MKMITKDCQAAPAIDRGTRAPMFVVALFAKRRPAPGEFAQKGEEIKVRARTVGELKEELKRAAAVPGPHVIDAP
jgi:hypothetical protein